MKKSGLPRRKSAKLYHPLAPGLARRDRMATAVQHAQTDAMKPGWSSDAGCIV